MGAENDPNKDKDNYLTKEEVARMLQEQNEKLEEQRKLYQSKIDTILSEKKNVATEKMSLEERLNLIEKEAREKEISWTRKEAKAKANIDDELELALNLYWSTDPNQIVSGADKLKDFFSGKEKSFAEKEEAYKKQIEELEKKLKYGANAPAAASGETNSFDKMSVDELNKFSLTSAENRQAVLNYLKNKKK